MNITEAMQNFADECRNAFIKAGYDIGLNSNNNIVHNITSEIHGDIINVLVPDYIEYIQSGRRRGSYVPIALLINWCGRMGISTENKVVYAIQQSIFNNGIAGRDIEGLAWLNIDLIPELYINNIITLILEPLDIEFNK